MDINKSFFEFVTTFKSIDADNQIVSGVVGSDDSVDRHGDRINPKGWDLKNYKKSPVILLNHDYGSMPVGKAIDVRIEDNKLVFDIEFSKTYDVAIQAFNLIKEGIWKAWSVGFLVKEWARSGEDYTINKAELLELSLVTVPANPNALTPKQLGMVEAFTKAVEETKPPESKPAEEIVEDKPAEEVVEPVEPTIEEKMAALDKTIQEQLAEVKHQMDAIAEKVELVEKSIDEKIDNRINAITTSTISDTESDESNADNPVLEALNAVKAELIDQNKDSGKALKALNQLLVTFQKE